jgi:hypothetical protein
VRVLCLLLLAWALPAGAQATDDVRGGLEECLDKLSAVPKKDFEAISSLCSSLPSVLETSPYAAWLPQNWWQEPLHHSSLQEFAGLIDYLGSAPAARGPDAALLGPILEEIRQVEIQRGQSLFERIREWIRERFQPAAAQEEGEPAWIKWVEQLARHQAFLRILSYVLLVLIVGLALGIVFVELKAAGVFDRRAREKPVRGPRSAAGLSGADTFEDLDTIDPLLRPSRLLDMVLATLAGPQRARVDRARTHRELQQTVRFDEAVQGQRFENLARCAERVRYSPSPPPRTDIDRAVASGQELLAALESRA